MEAHASVTEDGVVSRRHWFEQFWRFAVVGATNTVVAFVTYRLLLAAGAWYVAAAPLAFAAGAVNGYFFNRRWTFAARDSARSRLIYLAVTVGGAIATSVLVAVFAEDLGVGKVVAYLAAIPPVTVGMFTANRVWTFASRD
jgi:putative flippase GtrA